MDICKVFVPIGALGGGIDRASFQAGIDKRPDIISLDAGSTDSGPYYLGTGNAKYAPDAVLADLRLVLEGAVALGIPVTIGSCGTCGTDNVLDDIYDMCRQLLDELGAQKRIARIYTEQIPQQLAQDFVNGKVLPLAYAPEIDASTFEKCGHIVALAGIEPFIAALESGADEWFILLKEGQRLRAVADDAFRTAGFAPKILYETSNTLTAYYSATQGNGLCFLLTKRGFNRSDDLQFFLFGSRESPRIVNKFVMAFRAGAYRSHAAAAVADILKEVAEQAFVIF